MRVIGADIGDIINNLITTGGTTASRIWCVGHSLGAHGCGAVGQRVSKNGLIGRIIGE